MDNNSIQNQNNANPAPPIQPVNSEPIQNQTIAEPVIEAVRPSLARRLHLKLFSLLSFIVLIISAVLYYRNHPLPDFISSQADKLPSILNSGRTLRSSTIIESQNGSSSGSTTRMIVESVGRSETAYRSVTVIQGSGSDSSTLEPAITNTATSLSCVSKGGIALSTRQEDSNCCPGLYVVSASCPDIKGGSVKGGDQSVDCPPPQCW